MKTLQIECTVDQTKNPKWVRLTPVDRAPIGPVVIKADDIDGASRLTVTIKG